MKKTPKKGSPLRAMREALGLTQREVAIEYGAHQVDVGRAEARAPGRLLLSTLARYAAACGCSLEIVCRRGRHRFPIGDYI